MVDAEGYVLYYDHTTGCSLRTRSVDEGQILRDAGASWQQEGSAGGAALGRKAPKGVSKLKAKDDD